MHLDLVVGQVNLLHKGFAAAVQVTGEVVLTCLVPVDQVFLQRRPQLEAQPTLAAEETLHSSTANIGT